jgi:diguanylate cyclase (GGDEF)-like protein
MQQINYKKDVLSSTLLVVLFLVLISLTIVGISVYFLSSLETTLMAERKRSVKNSVDAMHGTISYYQKLAELGKLSEHEAKAAALALINDVRYEGHNYFWINDMAKPYPQMLVHPTIPLLNGLILSDEKFNCAKAIQYGDDDDKQALDGKTNLFLAFILVAEQSKRGYVWYDWQKPLAQGDVSSLRYPKVSYVRKVDGWNWIVGSGVYFDDIERAYTDTSKQIFWILFLVFVVYLVFAVLFSRRIIKTERALQREQRYLKNILDASPNPTLITNGIQLLDMNRAMLSVLHYDTLEAFRVDHDCICDFFVQDDKQHHFLQPVMGDQSWIRYVIAHTEYHHRVKLLIKGENLVYQLSAASITVAGNEARYIVIFTDISLLVQQSTTDALTGIANRQHFDLMLKHSMANSKRSADPLSIIFFDIDYFKKINDNFGHLVGDAVLRDLAQLVNHRLRESDLLARWGGEEFIILLSNTNLSAAVKLAELLRQMIVQADFVSAGHISCSFGVTQWRNDESEDALLQRVDGLLYQAKETGRNRVVVD